MGKRLLITVLTEIRIHVIINGGQEMDWGIIDRVITKGLIFRSYI